MGSYYRIEKYILHFPQKNAQGCVEVTIAHLDVEKRVLPRCPSDRRSDEKWVVSVNRSKRKVWVTRGQNERCPKSGRFKSKFLTSFIMSSFQPTKLYMRTFTPANWPPTCRRCANFPEGLRRASGRSSFTTTRQPTQKKWPKPPSILLASRVYRIPPYSPDLAHLVQTSLRDKTLGNEEEVIESKHTSFLL